MREEEREPVFGIMTDSDIETERERKIVRYQERERGEERGSENKSVRERCFLDSGEAGGGGGIL